MRKYLRFHEEYVRRALAAGETEYGWPELAEFHRQQIQFLQHERLIHLLVTLAFGLYFLILFGIMISYPHLLLMILDLLFFVLLVPYVIHYFILERGVQRWYHLANEIERRAYRKPGARPYKEGDK